MQRKQILIYLFGTDVILLKLNKITGHLRGHSLFELDFPSQDGQLILLTQLLDSVIALFNIILRCEWSIVLMLFTIFQAHGKEFIFGLLPCQHVYFSVWQRKFGPHYVFLNL